MKKLLLLLLTFLLVPFAFAEISLTSEMQNVYNLGDQLQVEFSVQEAEQDAIFKVNLDCSPYGLNYFTNLISLENNVSQTISPPTLKVSEDMLWSCKLKAFLTSFDKVDVASFESDEFIITDELQVNFDIERSEFLPGEMVVISSDAEVNVLTFFRDQELNFNPGQDPTFILEANIPSGDHDITLLAEDEFGNKVEKTLVVTVLPVPTSLEVVLDKTEFFPKESGKITVNLYDQANALIDGKDIDFKLADLIDTSIRSNNPVSFDIPEFTPPGDYGVVVSFDALSAESQIIVNEVKELEIVFQDNLAYVKNIGNIKYDEDVDFNLDGELTRIVTKKINLEPDETTIIDLSREVPQGSYDVSTEVDESTASVELEDNRNVVKKTAQGIDSITGAVIGSHDGRVSYVPFIVLLIIVVGIVSFFIFGRKKERVKF